MAERVDVGTEELSRAARLLAVRGRREATGIFAGNYASAFRGGGIEFEESRPWEQGDDVATFDWNATARTGEPYVKRFRAERNQTMLFAIDVSGSMRFGSAAASKLATAVHALALLAAAAVRVGDRIGLVAFDEQVRESLPPGRGAAHAHRVGEAVARCLAAPGGATRIAPALRALRAATRQRSVVVLLSDFLDPALAASDAALCEELGRLGRRHELVAGCVRDARERELVSAGGVRVEDPERPGSSWLLASSSRRVRDRYRAAAAARDEAIARTLRRCAADTLWLETGQSPLHRLARFLHERAGRRVRGAA
jgi:uncharacterized protein (DUF58 family)